MRAVCIWPDGTWCELDELECMSHMSDDHATVALPRGTYPEAVGAFVEGYLAGQASVLPSGK